MSSFDHHAEVSAVGCALVNPETIAVMNLCAEDFTSARLGRLYAAAREMAMAGDVPDVLEVARQTGIPVDWVCGVVDDAMTSNPESYAKQIRASGVRRQAAQIADRIAKGGDPAQEVPALLAMLQPARGETVTLQAALRVAIEKMESGVEGTPTGFIDWDSKIGPLGNGHLVVIGARPAMGKTAFALNLSMRCKGRTLFVSGEQPAHEIALRALAAESGVGFSVLKGGKPSEDAAHQMVTAGRVLKEKQIVIADLDSPSIGDVFAVSRKEHFTSPLSLIVVDYLQRMKTTGREQRSYAVGDNIQALKTLARQLNIPVVVLAQVNREVENRPDKRPHMADLKDSGIIEQEADVIAFLYRDEVYNEQSQDRGVCEVLISKNRHGPTGMLRLFFRPETMKFDDCARY